MDKTDVVKAFNSVRTSVVKHSPEILTGFGIAGMVTTTVLAVKATPKALRLIEDARYEKGSALTKGEKVKAAWKCYIPAAITCAVSTSCLIGASSVSLRRNAALATAYKLSESALVEYRDKVVETIGEKKEKVVREKVAEEQVERNPVSKNEVYITTKGDTLFMDPLSKRYFKSDFEVIRKAENELNARMLHNIFGYVSVNDFYDEIGLERTETGDMLGWNVNELIKIDRYPIMTEEGQPCIVLDFTSRPKYDYEKY